MKFSLRKLAPTYQWLLAGIIPLLTLLYVSWQLYSEKENRVSVASGYNSRIHESVELASLTGELETEAQYSLAFALNKGRYSSLIIQRSRTDKWIHNLEESGNTSLTNFLKYTFRRGLISARGAQDDGSAANEVQRIMDFYHDALWQFSTIYTLAPANNPMLDSLHAAVESQRLLLEMETLLAITRNKIYLSVLTAHDSTAIVSIAVDAWHKLKTCEAAFFLRAPAPLKKMYNDNECTSALRAAFADLDYVVMHHQFDSTYTAGQWWATASGGIRVLHEQYLVSQQQVQTGMNHIYKSEIKARNLTLLLLVAVILLVTGFFIFTVREVNKVLKKQRAVFANASPVKESTHAQNPPDDDINDLILEAIYRAGKPNGATTNGATINGAANRVNGHTVPVVKAVSDDNAVPKTNGKIVTNKQTEWIRNEMPRFPLKLTKPQENPASEVNDDMANYEIPKREIAPETNGKIVKESIAPKAEQRTDSLTSQMNELIDAAAIESGRFNYHKHIFKLNDLVSEMVSETGNPIKISMRKNAALSVYGDRARIAQVLSNLLQNAIDHCPNSDSIIVNLEEKNQLAVCSVEDFGNGIAIDQQEKIFEKFYRVNNTNGVSHAGLGLGLYIAIEIIKQHRGQMWVMSEPGLGSTFYFSLPVSTSSK